MFILCLLNTERPLKISHAKLGCKWGDWAFISQLPRLEYSCKSYINYNTVWSMTQVYS